MDVLYKWIIIIIIIIIITFHMFIVIYSTVESKIWMGGINRWLSNARKIHSLNPE